MGRGLCDAWGSGFLFGGGFSREAYAMDGLCGGGATKLVCAQVHKEA
jgi:hypothetical protein